MLLNEAADIIVGSTQVEAAYIGDTMVWSKHRELKISTDVIWLVDENDIEIVDVTSNTQWFVE